MPTQSQRRQKETAKQKSMSGEDGIANMTDIVRLVLEDHWKREELAEERRCREEELAEERQC